jgi:RimJ/RimL family protein N-acetyltransferase
VRAYEKAGFRPEGTLREAMFLGGRRVDLLVMGLLSRELG